ncbi:DUF1990 family protein [Anatilimnocola sp. NA78]|uniref:DUF1990 family protein n=1 Tax=Anatilimnocola sp. NA78 TaxID=3415683 RepID=UPI003CE51BF5
MISLRKPSAQRITAYLAGQRDQPLSYDFCGRSRDLLQAEVPSGFVRDHRRASLGHGDLAWQRAKDAIRTWVMFRNGWTELHAPQGPPQNGNVVGMLVRIAGLWWLNPCRVLYEVDDAGPIKRFGFGYGTLHAHAERGEERFLVEQDAAGEVWYDLGAFSQPRNLLVRMCNPWARHIQLRFGRDSAAAMQRYVSQATQVVAEEASMTSRL